MPCHFLVSVINHFSCVYFIPSNLQKTDLDFSDTPGFLLSLLSPGIEQASRAIQDCNIDKFRPERFLDWHCSSRISHAFISPTTSNVRMVYIFLLCILTKDEICTLLLQYHMVSTVSYLKEDYYSLNLIDYYQ